MAGDTTLQALKRLSWLPDRDASDNGNVIAGQEYYDVEFVGGTISNVLLSNVTINGETTQPNERVITESGNVSVVDTDYVILINKDVGEATTVTLPSSPFNRIIVVKDVRGDANSYNITIDGNGKDIDGDTNMVLDQPYQSVYLIYSTLTDEWSLIAEANAPGSGGGSGTVTSVSVVNNNGFNGTVANPTTTPAITLTTTVNGILQGNGTAISAAPTTGSGDVVRHNSPSLTTPDLGVAVADSINVGNTGLTVGISTPFSDSSGTLTLQNVDALDTATENTIEAAIDTLPNLTSIQGNSFTVSGAANISGTNTGDQNLFGTISVAGQSDVVADTTNDTLTLVAGSNVTITTNAATDTITISASGGGGGSSAFNDITTGTNTTATMTVGTGASLTTSGSGTIAATSAPLSGISGLGTNVATALAVNVGSSGAFVVNGGALGTPSSGTATNLTGTASGLTAGTATVANTVSTSNEVSDTTCFPLFVTASGTQSLQPKNNTALTFNSSTGALGATSFSGAGTGLTGTAASLTAGTVTTNANLTGDVTSVGNATSIAAGVIVNADINASAAIDATKIANGSVSNTEFQYLDGVNDSIQNQLNSKLSNIVGLVTAGSNVTIDGFGTSVSPYVINATGGGGGGGVSGPGSSTDTAIALWNGTNGDALRNSTVTIGSGGTITTTEDLYARSVYTGLLQSINGVTLSSTDPTFGNTLTSAETLTGNRTLGIVLNDANRTLTVSGNATISGTNTGNVTLAGENYLSLSGQQITANAVNLSNTNVTGTLAAARFPALTGDITTSAGSLTTAIAAGAIVNADVNASAAIALSKLAATTASRALVSDASGFVTAATTTATEIGYVNGVTSSIQTQLNGKQSTGNYITALTGDATASGPGSSAITFATVNSNTGSFGSATQTGVFTVNAKGLVTAASNTTITPAVGSITGLGTGVSTALAVNVGSAGSLVVNGGALGTPASGTLTNATGLPIVGGTTGTLSVARGGTGATTITGLVKGNGTSAFTAATAGTDYVTPTGNETLTNKRINPRATTLTSSATPQPAVNLDDLFELTALAVNATFAAPSGSPTNGQALIIRIKDNGTPRTLAWNAIYRAVGVILPTTTVASKWLYLSLVYNSNDTRWDVTGVGQQA